MPVMTKVDLNAVFNRMADTRRGVITRPKIFHIFSIPLLKSEAARCIVKTSGLRNPTLQAAIGPSAGAIPHFFNSNLFAGLRERSCVIMAGTTCSVFLTPEQARFFCAPKKGAKKAYHQLSTRRTA